MRLVNSPQACLAEVEAFACVLWVVGLGRIPLWTIRRLIVMIPYFASPESMILSVRICVLLPIVLTL